MTWAEMHDKKFEALRIAEEWFAKHLRKVEWRLEPIDQYPHEIVLVLTHAQDGTSLNVSQPVLTAAVLDPETRDEVLRYMAMQAAGKLGQAMMVVGAVEHR